MAGRREWLGLAVLSVPCLLTVMDLAVLVLAVPELSADLEPSATELLWITDIYGFLIAGTLITMGTLGDRIGRRRLLLIGSAAFALTSLLAAYSTSPEMLIAARGLQGVAGATLVPCAMALLFTMFTDERQRGTALGVLMGCFAVGAALGPVLGGVLVTLAGWQAIFFVNVVVGLVALPLSLRWLPRDPQHEGGVSLSTVRRLVDLPGIAAFAVMLASVLALLLSLVSEPLWWLVPVGLAAGGLLVLNDRRREDPFLDVRMLAGNRALLGVCVQYLLVNVVAFGVFFSVPLWLEAARGLSSGAAGAMVIPLAGVAVFATPFAARIVSRSGERPALLAGAVAMVAGTLLLLTFSANTPLWAVVPVTVVLGIPIGFNNLGLQSALYGASDPERTGAAAGIFQTCRFIGAVLATSLLGVVFADGVDSAGLHQMALILAGVSAVVLAGSLRRERRPASAAR
jgi:EmrB/QacA subfamily drug resistance transporter